MLLTATLATPLSAQNAVPPNAETGFGDGRVSSFYTWTERLAGRPGTLLRSEALAPEQGLSEASEQRRILYTSTDGVTREGLVAVSGALFLPKGNPPEGGWPLIAWAHGTVGIADICAPSWAGRSYRDNAYLNEWLRKGFAIVATDYQGLGTPGTHPYNQLRPEAYSVLDSIRAVKAAEPRLGARSVVIGQSQGGGAAFAAAAYRAAYAPELALAGAVATGTPYITLALLASIAKNQSDKVDPTIAYHFYLALTLGDPAEAKRLFSEAAQPVMAAVGGSCIAAAQADIRFAQLTPANTLNRAGLAAAVPRLLTVMRYPTLRPDVPVFLGIGGKDADVSPLAQMQLARDSCAAGATISVRLYPDLDHSGAFAASLPDALAFAQDLMAGKPAPSNCADLPG
ncbi:hypothetical protein ASF53_21090 [Methylobacterium sp. Leaf123]|nr:hypothetical protein ASF53_21090 [Methylobacterium sp. Leaf123]